MDRGLEKEWYFSKVKVSKAKIPTAGSAVTVSTKLLSEVKMAETEDKRLNRRLSRKKSVMALDRLKRSFSYQSNSPSGSLKSSSGGSTRNLTALDPSYGGDSSAIAEVDVTIEKISVRRTQSNTIPETIMEEEAERIRRESLKPVNGDVSRLDSIDGDDEDRRGKEGDMESKQKRDEGLGESFDRNSELSDRDSVSRAGSSNVVEMVPVGDGGKPSPAHLPLSASPLHRTLQASQDVKAASPEDPRWAFLDASMAKRVTFM